MSKTKTKTKTKTTNRTAIVEEIRALVKKENELCAQIIRNLQSIYDQKIHLEMGYSGLFNFCVKELGMSEATAQRRCDAVRLTRFVPDLPKQIEQGVITLNRVAEVSKFIRQERKETGRDFHMKEVQKLVTEAKAHNTD